MLQSRGLREERAESRIALIEWVMYLTADSGDRQACSQVHGERAGGG